MNLEQNAKPQLTIRRLWDYLGADYSALPSWPPDLFAMCAAVLKKSGAYTSILNPFSENAPRGPSCVNRDDHASHLQGIGGQWRANLSNSECESLPLDEMTSRWFTVSHDIDLELFRVADNPKLANALLDLLAISDEACQGLGLPLSPDPKAAVQPVEHEFREEADQILFPKQFGSTLCKSISPSAVRVLPKMHTVQSGLTLRSLSHHLAYCDSDEVRPSWISVPGSRGNASDISRMNILIAPWPDQISPSQITERRKDSFEFQIKSTDGKIAERCLALVLCAQQMVGDIDAVLFPELAMTTRDYRLVRAVLLRRGIMTIAGIGSRRRATNYLAIDVPISKSHAVHFRQRKHHRWKLDKNQIEQYHLGSRLKLESNYWEHIEVQDRQLNFIVLRPWLVASALICEDLARHDPVGDLIKSVGPNLVMALLMDGPQIDRRWSARYAAGLADDPGSSVLSITSLGMAQLSRPRGTDGKSSRVVALWKDAFSGSPTQIDMPKGSDGVVITLTMKGGTELTADYRTDGGLARYPTLAGFHFLTIPTNGTAAILKDPPKTPVWLTPSEAGFLARLVQRNSLNGDFMPEGLAAMRGAAFRIGREIWRLRTSGSKAGDLWATAEEADTAEQIMNWHNTNYLESTAKGLSHASKK